MRKRINELIHHSSEHFYYVGATIISAGVHFLYSVFVKAHIEPLEFGIYSTCLLLETYLTYLQLGSLNAFNRDYPQLIGAGESEKSKKYRDTTFTFLVLAFGIATVLISIALFATGGLRDSRYTFGLILCSVITIVTIIESFLVSRVRIDGGFKFTSFVMLAELISVAVGFLLITRIGYYGLYAVAIGTKVIGIALCYKRGLSDIRFRIDKPLLKTVIVSGIPLLINNLIWTVVNSIDKFVILGFINTEALGIYSIAQMAFKYMVLIPSAMSQLFYVKLGKVYGATNKKEILNSTATKYTTVLAVIVSFIVICAYFFIEPLVAWLMPKYIGGTKSAQVLMLGLAIYAPTTVNSNILTILKKNATLLRGSIYLCILNVICSVGLVLLRGATIENVALGTAISYLIRTGILVYQLKHNAGTNVLKMIKASILPVLITAGPGILMYHFIENRYIGFAIAITIACAVILLVYRKYLTALFKEK